jgi:uncharacterized membrane protein YuzA (DUF378 family)
MHAARNVQQLGLWITLIVTLLLGRTLILSMIFLVVGLAANLVLDAVYEHLADTRQPVAQPTVPELVSLTSDIPNVLIFEYSDDK